MAAKPIHMRTVLDMRRENPVERVAGLSVQILRRRVYRSDRIDAQTDTA